MGKFVMNVVREQGAIDIYYLGFIQKELEIENNGTIWHNGKI